MEKADTSICEKCDVMRWAVCDVHQIGNKVPDDCPYRLEHVLKNQKKEKTILTEK